MSSSTIDPADTISPSQITGDYVPASPLDFATPAPTSYTEGSPTPSQDGDGESSSSKRKRKSWGQPIPDYEKVLPPGKRAKTNEEKEQRRCERIVRNRRAAATSRDRKKHEFESLQLENQALKEQLEQQRAVIAALQNGQPIPAFSNPVPFTSSTAQSNDALPTPAFSAVDSQAGNPAARASSPAISVISLPRAKHTSPTLAPSLFIKSEAPEDSTAFPSNIPDSFPELPLDNVDDAMNTFLHNPQMVLETFTHGLADSSLTQYPAAVLCDDLQCQLESAKLTPRPNNKWVNSVLIIQLIVLNAISSISSDKMISALTQVLTSLEWVLSTIPLCPTTMDMILPLIQSLITLPTTEKTSRRAFRMAFLRRLLSCSPASARLIDDATSRALQRLSSAEAIQESSRDGLSWASLMTMRWAIKSIGKEEEFHEKRIKILPKASPTTAHDEWSSISSGFEGALLGSLGQPPERGACTTPHVH